MLASARDSSQFFLRSLYSLAIVRSLKNHGSIAFLFSIISSMREETNILEDRTKTRRPTASDCSSNLMRHIFQFLKWFMNEDFSDLAISITSLFISVIANYNTSI